MNDFSLWVVESAHTNPTDFYVRVDGSDIYIAYWIVCSSSEGRAQQLASQVSEELLLGNTETIAIYPYRPGDLVKDDNVTARMGKISTKFSAQEDIQLAAWITSEGGLW